MPEMDINAAANEVVALLRQNDARAAAARLDALHQGQSVLVQESLDRYVSSRAATELEALRQLQQQSREHGAATPAPAQQQEAPAMGGR